MKLIDLLNKIANGEEVPKKILYKYSYKDFYKEYRLKWNKKYKGYYTTNDKTPITHLLADNLWNLNAEIEIIEEDKKIDILPMLEDDEIFITSCAINQTRRKINEIIDKLNKE